MISVAIADDEVLARQKLQMLLRAEVDVNVVGEAASGSELVVLLRNAQVDLVFLDVRMPELDGLAALESIRSDTATPCPQVIFTTAYDSFAVQAFELRAVDYLLKPFTPVRFQEALQRVRQVLASGGMQSTKSGEQRDRLIFKSGGRIIFLPVQEIVYVAAEENYVRVVTAHETHLMRETLSRFESRLDPKRFLKIHRSTIVNLRHVREIRQAAGRNACVAEMTNGHKLIVSKSFRSAIFNLAER